MYLPVISILTAPTRAFYERSGYKKVAQIPDYYVEDEGRIDYFKLLN